MTLSPCQEKAYEILRGTRENVFLTGHAGTGKSFLIRRFLKDKDRKRFPVLASTGVAAVLLGGRTFHSFFGLGIMDGGVAATIDRALANKRVVARLASIDGFVLDEVSMISGPTLRAAEAICRAARKIRAPWGGARVVATGDFAQLPPVSPRGQAREWAFQDPSWNESEWRPVVLETVMRSADREYIDVLNRVREGVVDDDVRAYLNRKLDPDAAADEVAQATCLFPLRETAETVNRQRLARLPSKLVEIATKYAGDSRAVEALQKQAPIPQVLHLKEDALVMLRINDPGYKYVNGSLATVSKIGAEKLEVELINGRGVELEKHTFAVQDADGKPIATAINFPVTLAYATTIHKSQGATLDRMTCDLRRLWEPGQAYVALSRLRTGAGLSLLGWDEASIRADPAVAAFHKTLPAASVA